MPMCFTVKDYGWNWSVLLEIDIYLVDIPETRLGREKSIAVHFKWLLL